MDAFISSYTTLTTGVVTGLQRLGILSLPLVLAIAALVNLFGGERAIKAVGIAIGIAAILLLILSNAVAISNFLAPGAH